MASSTSSSSYHPWGRTQQASRNLQGDWRAKALPTQSFSAFPWTATHPSSSVSSQPWRAHRSKNSTSSTSSSSSLSCSSSPPSSISSYSSSPPLSLEKSCSSDAALERIRKTRQEGAAPVQLPPEHPTFADASAGKVFFISSKMSKSAKLYRALEKTRNIRALNHMVVVTETFILSGEEIVRLRLCTSQDKSRYNDYDEVHDPASSESQDGLLKLAATSECFPKRTWICRETWECNPQDLEFAKHNIEFDQASLSTLVSRSFNCRHRYREER